MPNSFHENALSCPGGGITSDSVVIPPELAAVREVFFLTLPFVELIGTDLTLSLVVGFNATPDQGLCPEWS